MTHKSSPRQSSCALSPSDAGASGAQSNPKCCYDSFAYIQDIETRPCYKDVIVKRFLQRGMSCIVIGKC